PDATGRTEVEDRLARSWIPTVDAADGTLRKNFAETILRCQREAGVGIQNPGNTPTSGDLLHPGAAAVENRWRPDAVHLEGMANVVVRGRKGGRQIQLIEGARVCVRSGLHGMTQTLLRVQQEGVAKRMLRFQQQGV